MENGEGNGSEHRSLCTAHRDAASAFAATLGTQSDKVQELKRQAQDCCLHFGALGASSACLRLERGVLRSQEKKILIYYSQGIFANFMLLSLGNFLLSPHHVCLNISGRIVF